MSYSCSPSNYFTASRTITSGNEAACNQDVDVNYSPCNYCSNPGGFCTNSVFPQRHLINKSSCSDSVCNNAWPGYYLESYTVCSGCGKEGQDAYSCTCSPRCNSRNTCLLKGNLSSTCVVWIDPNCPDTPGCPPGYSCIEASFDAGCAFLAAQAWAICR